MIKNISLLNFRRFNHLDLKISNNLLILIGANAVGKTTVLEAISLISTSKSHRTTDYTLMIQEKKDYAVVNIDTDKHYEMILSQNGKKASINNVEYKKTSEFIGNLKSVLFSPEDLYLVIGTKSIRRNFLDLEISMLDKKYLSLVSDYKKLLKKRNDLLKQYSDDKKVLLDVITSELIEKCNGIMLYRSSFINTLNKYIHSLNDFLINNEVVTLEYRPSIPLEDLEEAFKAKLNYDIQTKMTNYGVHRDDFKIILNNQEASQYASQGQIRGIAITIKIALLELIKAKTKDNVVLLLDDVFSELDDTRQSNLVKYLLGQGQSFITTTNVSSIPNELIKKAQIIKIESRS